MSSNRTKQSRGDNIFDIINYIILTIALIVVLYPLYFIVIASVSNPDMVNTGKVWLLPKDVTLDGYKRVFQDTKIWIGYRNTIFYTMVGTFINILLTLPAAYALSRKDLYGRNFFMGIFTFTMFFGGGLIPTYMLIRKLGMENTVWAMLIPGAVWVWNLIVAKTFFESTIPDELLEAAVIDGCSNTKFFISIVMPLSKAITAVMVLFYGVGHWNEFFDALIYLRDPDLSPLQIVLREILIQNEVDANMMADASAVSEMQRLSEMIKYAVIIVASLPVLIVYPFLQKYFVQGVMLGAIKG